jgi:hypothetical protein
VRVDHLLRDLAFIRDYGRALVIGRLDGPAPLAVICLHGGGQRWIGDQERPLSGRRARPLRKIGTAARAQIVNG